MKRFLSITLLAAFALPLAAYAAEFKAGEQYALRKGEVINQNLYVAGGSITVEGDVKGDLLVAGGMVIVTGSVAKDLMVAGGNLNLSGSVGEDLRVVGGTITISGVVNGELVVAGGQVHVLSGATINGDVLALGGQLNIDGTIKGKVQTFGGKISVDGTVAGGIDATANKELRIGSHANIKNGVTYKSPKEAAIEQGSTIVGDVAFTKAAWGGKRDATRKNGMHAFLGIWLVLKFLMMLTAGLALFFLAPRASHEVVKNAFTGFWGAIARGFIILVVFPPAIILALITVIGIPIGVLATFGYINLMIVSSIFAGILFGSFLMKHAFRKGEYGLSWKTVVIGIITLSLTALVPIVGWIICFAFFLASLGTVAPLVYRQAKSLARG